MEALGTVVLHQRKSLTVVSIQAGAQRCLIIIAAPYEWFARYLSGGVTKRKKKLFQRRKFNTEICLKYTFNVLLTDRDGCSAKSVSQQ